MKKINCLVAIVFAYFLSAPLFSQQDSAYLDLGRIKIKKDFIQSVTIKGTDLERMPFANIADALKVWMAGAYTNANNLLYVIDGNLVQDPNTWSIYDIEEITWVQNAMSLLNGVIKQTQLVLIKTKTRLPGDHGIRVAAQSFLVNTDYSNQNLLKSTKSETNFYQQLYVSAYKNFKHIQFGASVNYLRDVYPDAKADSVKVNKPYHTNRFRLHGWLNAALGKWNNLSIQIGYMPQLTERNKSYYTSYTQDATYTTDGKSWSVNPSLHLATTITKELSNDLKVAYVTAKGHRDDYNSYQYNTPPQNTLFEQYINGVDTFRNFVLSDHITYHKEVGNLTIESSLDFQFRHIKHNVSHRMESLLNHSFNSVSGSWYALKNKLFLLTPGVNIYYKDIFSLQGGLIANISKYTGYPNSKRNFPYMSVMIDLMKLTPHNGNSLKIFGSYSKGEELGEFPFHIPYAEASTQNQGIIMSSGIIGPYSHTNRYAQAGFVFRTASSNIEISYNFDNRTYIEAQYLQAPGGGYYPYVSDYKIYSHRIGLLGKFVTRDDFDWSAGLNMTTSVFKGRVTGTFFGGQSFIDGDRAYTGGTNNNFRYKKIIMGFSLLYLLNEPRGDGPINIKRENSFLLQNIYLGYSTTFAKQQQLELYFDCKNLAQNDVSNLTDWRRYYGFGFKMQLQ